MASLKSTLLLLGLVTYAVVLHYQLAETERELRDALHSSRLRGLGERAPQQGGLVESADSVNITAAVRCEGRAMRLSDRVDELQGQADVLKERLRRATEQVAGGPVARPLPSSVSTDAARVFIMALTAPTEKAANARAMMRKTWLNYRMEGGPPGAVQHRFVVSSTSTPTHPCP
jgi:hypothetical protein